MRKTIDLQLFADAVRGKKIVYLYRLKKDAAKNAATALAFTTENGRTTSKDADTQRQRMARSVPREQPRLRLRQPVFLPRATH